jgi:hypothetical protein
MQALKELKAKKAEAAALEAPPVSQGRKLMRFPAWELESLRDFRNNGDTLLVQELGWETVEKVRSSFTSLGGEPNN